MAVLDAFNGTVEWPPFGTTPTPSSPASAREREGRAAGGGWMNGMVVFGGEMNADQLDRYPYLLRVRKLIREAVDWRIPTLGICLGAQILARAFGALVYRAPVRELGFLPIHPAPAARTDPLLNWLQPGDQVFQWHEDTFDLPSGATLLATGEMVAVQAFRVGSGWGVQFHPEVNAEEIEGWLRDAAGTLETVWGRKREQVMGEVAANLDSQAKRAEVLFQEFARQVGLGASGAFGP